MDQFFNNGITDMVGMDASYSMPSTNILEEKDRFLIEMAAPGLTKSSFNINVDRDQLTVSAEKSEQEEENKENYKRREFNYTHFSRSFQLPKLVNKENIEASYEHGILRINLPKMEEAIEKEPMAIEIK
jgi:HSP20 family protein